MTDLVYRISPVNGLNKFEIVLMQIFHELLLIKYTFCLLRQIVGGDFSDELVVCVPCAIDLLALSLEIAKVGGRQNKLGPIGFFPWNLVHVNVRFHVEKKIFVWVLVKLQFTLCDFNYDVWLKPWDYIVI